MLLAANLESSGDDAVMGRSMGYRKMRARANECHYCHQKLLPEIATRDHVVPRSLGGTNALINLVPSCDACNQMKADTVRWCGCVQCMLAVAYHAALMQERKAAALADDVFDLANAGELGRWL